MPKPSILACLALTACTSDSSSPKAFVPATKPADVCAMLALTDVQAILPSAELGGPDQQPDTADTWLVSCNWNSTSAGLQAVDLVIFGAKTEAGIAMNKANAVMGETVDRPYANLGEEAHYWEDQNQDNGLWAVQGSYVIGLAALTVSPAPTADQMKPLVVKALGEVK